MRRPANANGYIILFGLLVIGSLGLKAAIGPPRDRAINTEPGLAERTITRVLVAHDFKTALRTYPYRSKLVLAERGACRIAVRDATFGAALAPAFADDAKSVGSVRYFYGGKGYDRPPAMAVRWGRFKFEVLDRVGLKPSFPLLVAVASSPECGTQAFGLSDLHVRT